MPHASYDAIILAGARSERLGGADKAMVEVDGLTLLDRVLGAATGAERRIVVGPSRPTTIPVTWVEEQPIGGGPATAFAAGIEVASSDTILLLAVDLPFIAGAVPTLLAALTPSCDVALLEDQSGRANYLASVWRRSALTARLASLPDLDGLPLRRLLEGLRVAGVRDTGGWSFDCDTWDAVEQARTRGVTSTP